MKIVNRRHHSRVVATFHECAPAKIPETSRQLESNEAVASAILQTPPAAPVPQTVTAHQIEEIKMGILQELKKAPQLATDLVTLKHANDMLEKVYLRITKERRDALASYSVHTPVQYIFLNQASQRAEKQSDGVFQFNLAETFMWPAKATIVSAHVQHSLAGTSSLRMYSFQSQNARTDVATSETAPYSARGLQIEIPPDTKVWFSVGTSNQIPTVSVVLGVIFHPIDLISPSVNA